MRNPTACAKATETSLSATDAGKGKLNVLEVNEERTFRIAWRAFQQGEPGNSKQRKLNAALAALETAIDMAEENKLDDETTRLAGFQRLVSGANGDIIALNELELKFL